MRSDGERILPEWADDFKYSRPGLRYKVAYGGRGSGKSWAFARLLLVRAYYRPIRILCARELQNSIQDSVHQLLVDQINELRLQDYFHVKESKIVSHVGAEFLFKGLRGMKNNAQAIKSLEGVDICWIEEGQTVSASSFETLTPTIRKRGAEIWITFNPDQETDPVYRFVQSPPDGSIVRKVNWDSNPWFLETSLPSEREWMQKTDMDAYRHIWEGECRRFSDAQVLRGKYVVERFSPMEYWSGPYFGSDWGFSVDPTALVKLWIFENVLYIEKEVWAVGCEIDQTPALFDRIPEARQHVIRADSARPETISYMRRAGFHIRGADKGKGSVEDGVAHLRSYERIVIHPDCKHAIEEARLWSYKVDALSGDILIKLQTGNDHIWDAARYALEPIMQRGNGRQHITTSSNTSINAW